MGIHGDVVSSYCAAEPCPVRLSDSFANVHGFLLSGADGHFTTIDFPDAAGTGAFGISARGSIVGAYVDASHTAHAYVRSVRRGVDESSDD